MSRDGEGGLRTMPCPYGGSGTVILKMGEDGEAYGKCGLASMTPARYVDNPRGRQLSQLGCPVVSYKGENYGYQVNYGMDCHYLRGDWTKI